MCRDDAHPALNPCACPTIGGRIDTPSWPGRIVNDEQLPKRRKRESLAARAERFVGAHKVIMAAIALIGIGAGGAIYMQRYATVEDVSSRHQRDGWAIDQIQNLKESDAELRSAIKAIQESSSETRDDMKTLLQHVLANPGGGK